MNRYEFEDKISDYIDNQLSSSERKAFEKYVEENPEAGELLSSTKNVIDLIKSQKKIKTSENFMPNLIDKVKAYKKAPAQSIKSQNKNMFFGLSPMNSALMGVFIFSFVFLLVNIIPSENGFFQSNIASNKKNTTEKTLRSSPPAESVNSKELVQADSTVDMIKPLEKTKLRPKIEKIDIELVKNKR